MAQQANSSNQDKHLIIVGGPTASGKSTFAISLAKHFNAPIISADSRQIYKEMTIGTAKPSTEELNTVNHYLIGHRSITENYSAGDFEREAKNLLAELFKTEKIILCVGGTGLYLKAITEGLDKFPDIQPGTRDYYNQLLESKGISFLQNELKLKDPEYSKQVDLNNPHRVIRALSVIRDSGKKFSSFLSAKKNPLPYNIILLYLELERELLYDRINKRVDKMMKSGLVEEVRGLENFKNLNSLNTVGYKEIFNYLDGNTSLEVAIDKIKQHSRNYAKRQITWFRNQQSYTPIDPDKLDSCLELIKSKM